jgi:hypothetical protein
LPLRPALRSPYPTDEEVIRRIRAKVAQFGVHEGHKGMPNPAMLSQCS